ncbi:MAG: hypothetical protein DBX55_00125 [Verrucomicrobia bacterium]|nr:MAG: hypothetical protein DBX55_00125 [Verrucomicrobiota bacterium]
MLPRASDKQTPPAQNNQSAKLPQTAAETAEVFRDRRNPPRTKRQIFQTPDFSNSCNAPQIALTLRPPPHMRRLSRHFCRKKIFRLHSRRQTSAEKTAQPNAPKPQQINGQ